MAEKQMKSKVYLTGDELAEHDEALRLAAEREAKHQAMIERSRRMAQADADSSDSDSSGSDSDSDAPAAEVDFAPTAARKVGGFAGGAGAWDEFLDPAAAMAGGQSFDVYVKGAFAKRVAPGGGLERWRMFPVVERKRRVDAYGEAIDVEGWLRRGVDEEDEFTKGARLAREQGLVLGKRAREDEDKVEVSLPFVFVGLVERRLTEQDQIKEPPHKYVVEHVDADLACSLFVVDMEGKTDGRAIKTILPQINPRKLVRLSFPNP